MFYATWPNRFLSMDSTWSQEVARLNHEDSTAHFATTKLLIADNVRAIEAAKVAGRLAAEEVRHPSPEAILAALKARSEQLRAETRGADAWISHLKVRGSLVKRGLLYQAVNSQPGC